MGSMLEAEELTARSWLGKSKAGPEAMGSGMETKIYLSTKIKEGYRFTQKKFSPLEVGPER